MFKPHQTLEYESFTDVINEVRDVLIIDVAQHCLYLPTAFSEILLPEPAGIYTPNRLEPLFPFDQGQVYYTEDAYRRREPDVYDFDSFIKTRSLIFNHQGKCICQAPALAPYFFQKSCTYNYSAIHVAFILLYDMINHLHSQSFVGTNLPMSALRIERYVKPEFLQAVMDERISHPGHATLAAELYTFIGRDRQAYYRLRFENTTLLLEKGNDYRVVEYYRRLFDELEAERG